ncbi:MAG: DUF5706 domain-containing protein [Owenweeksia sp.]
MDEFTSVPIDKPSKKLKVLAIELMVENYDQLVYHTIGFAKRIQENLQQISAHEDLTESEMCQLEAAMWLYASSFSRMDASDTSKEAISSQQKIFINKFAKPDLRRVGYHEHEVEAITNAIIGMHDHQSAPSSKLQSILRDALIMDFIGKQSKERIEAFYQETVLNNANLNIYDFYGIIVDFLTVYTPVTRFSKEHIKPNLDKLIFSIEKERKRLRKKKDLLLKRELGVDEDELKTLRKNLSSLRGRDARGIQTLFRTTSHNHYTLNEMVDRKANIMITVNSVILSVVIGGSLGISETSVSFIIYISIFIMALASFVSIIFAIIAITPNRTQGYFTLEDIRNKNGNLLYYGNFHNMSFKDYEWGMLQKLNDSNFLYSSMIKDLYFLGKTLHRKYKFIRLSLQIFMAGIIASFLIFLIIRISG